MALKHHAAPQFFWILGRDGAPTAPGGRPFCEPTTHGCEPDFQHNPRLCLNPMLGESPLACRIGASQPRNVVGEGLGWVEHSHTESPGMGLPRPRFFQHNPRLC